MEEETKEKKFNLRVIILVISIVSFFIVVFSASFAFFSTTTADPTSGQSIANANVTVPVGCTFLANRISNCEITGQTGATINFNDKIITTAEMTESYKGNKVANATCFLEIKVIGNKGCSCNYALEIERVSGSDVYTPTNAQEPEFTAKIEAISGATWSYPETNINTLIGIPIHTDSLTVVTTGDVKYVGLSMDIKFYNTPSNQSQTIAGKHFSYALKAYATSCNGATLSSSSPTYSMLNSQGNVGKGAYGVFRSDADLSKLSGVQIDGQTIPSSNYTTSSGSTIIRLKPEYTNTLSLGNHTIKIVSNDGYATSDFTVDNPITFTIEDVGTFYASEGMTWADWIKSYGISLNDNGHVWICYSSLCGNNGVGRLAVDIGNGIGDNNITNPDHSGYTLYNDIIINNANYHVDGPR